MTCRFPRLYAAASLKQARNPIGGTGRQLCFPRLYAAASLKQPPLRTSSLHVRGFSAALCRGLIEAGCDLEMAAPTPAGFPRLYAAASLKRRRDRGPARGSHGFPRLYAAASLKMVARKRVRQGGVRFPRLYAAASLKKPDASAEPRRAAVFSAALCRGLIEERWTSA